MSTPGIPHSDGARVGTLMDILPRDAASMLDVGEIDEPRAQRSGPRTMGSEFVKLAEKRGMLEYPDGAFDLVACRGVLERLAGDALSHACDELSRVSDRYVLASVPYLEDLRLGRTMCDVCGIPNPPSGHMSVFDEETLSELFPGMAVVALAFDGETRAATNHLAAALIRMARNPYGEYGRGVECTVCGAEMLGPPPAGALRRRAGELGQAMNRVMERFSRRRPATLHVLLDKR